MQGGSSPSIGGAILAWTSRNQRILLASNALSLVVLFFVLLLTLTIKLWPIDLVILVHFASLVSAVFILLSVAPKGIIPIVISLLGVVLIHDSLMLTVTSTPPTGKAIMDGQIIKFPLSDRVVMTATVTHFFLGVSMVIFGTILAHKPTLLFTKNRPPHSDEEWAKYQLWQDNSILADGRTEQVVPVKSMMTEEDRRLLWRYEYVLANIYGSLYLVNPEGMVPKDSTAVLREKSSGRIIGKARFTGLFI